MPQRMAAQAGYASFTIRGNPTPYGAATTPVSTVGGVEIVERMPYDIAAFVHGNDVRA